MMISVDNLSIGDRVTITRVMPSGKAYTTEGKVVYLSSVNHGFALLRDDLTESWFSTPELLARDGIIQTLERD